MSEAKIQADIVQYLQTRGVYFFSVPNEAAGRDAAIRMARLKAMGLRSGVSDMVLIFPGQVVFVEVKDEKGKQSDAQRRFQDKVNELGFDYYLVRSVEDVEKVVYRFDN